MIRTIVENYIELIGPIWMPPVTCAQRKNLSSYDIENIGKLTRANIERWLIFHSGDFQHVADFHASIGATEIPWEKEESELTYCDCMCYYPGDE